MCIKHSVESEKLVEQMLCSDGSLTAALIGVRAYLLYA